MSEQATPGDAKQHTHPRLNEDAGLIPIKAGRDVQAYNPVSVVSPVRAYCEIHVMVRSVQVNPIWSSLNPRGIMSLAAQWLRQTNKEGDEECKTKNNRVTERKKAKKAAKRKGIKAVSKAAVTNRAVTGR